MLTAIDPRGGRLESLTILVGDLCLSTAVQGYVLEVGAPVFLGLEINTDHSTEDFALMEASCAIVKILQTFPNVRLPDGYAIESTGQERQTLGILITSADGCKVVLD